MMRYVGEIKAKISKDLSFLFFAIYSHMFVVFVSRGTRDCRMELEHRIQEAWHYPFYKNERSITYHSVRSATLYSTTVVAATVYILSIVYVT